MVVWMYSGRDTDGGLAVGVEWNPPKELTPAEVGTLVDEKCDMADIVSTLVDLAARGHLTIEEIKTEKFLFLSSRDYYFKRRVPSAQTGPQNLLPHESEFLRGLFGSENYRDNQAVLLSSLKNHFYTHLPEIRSNIYESLVQKGLFHQNPASVRSTYLGIGFVIGFFGVMARFCGRQFG